MQLCQGCFAAEPRTPRTVWVQPSSTVGSLAVYQRKRVSRPASTLGCSRLVDLFSRTALACLETNMQRMVLKPEEREAS